MKYFINFLTIFRIISALLIFVLIAFQNNYFYSLIIFFLAGITDYWDGYLARKFNLTSELGEVLDPIADKILIIFIFIAISLQLNSYYVGFLSSLIISREIWVASLRDINSRNNNTLATKVTFIAKTKTSVQFAAITFYLFGLTINNMLVVLIADISLFIAFLITWYTGFIYTKNTFFSKDN